MRIQTILSRIFILAFLCSLNPTVLFAQAVPVDIDVLLGGKFFIVEMRKSGSSKVEEDMFSFKANKFKSKLMNEKYSFPSAVYSADADTASNGEVTITWECVSKFEKTDLLVWKGTVIGETIEGTAQWTIKDKPKKTVDYEFTGTLKAKRK